MLCYHEGLLQALKGAMEAGAGNPVKSSDPVRGTEGRG